MRLPRLPPVYLTIKLLLLTVLSLASVSFSSQTYAELTPICIEHYIRAGAIPQGPNAPWRELLAKCEIPASTANYGGLGSPRCGNRTDQITEFCGTPCPSTATEADIAACFEPPVVNPFSPDKSKGPSCGGEGNPCDPGSGNKFEIEEDYASHSGYLSLDRFYNSTNPEDGIFGFGWSATGLSHIDVISDTEVMIVQANGRGDIWKLEGGVWQGDPDSRLLLEVSAVEFIVTYQNTIIETFNLAGQLTQKTDRSGLVTSYSYDASNRLSTITSPFARTLSFVFDSNNRVQSVVTPDGSIMYEYSSSGNLIKVTYPDNTSRNYHYEDANFQHHLTGITDENNKRFATWTYNSDGKATSSEHADGVEKVTLSYDTAQNQTTVTGALGDIRTYNFELLQGVYKTTTVSGDQCRTCDNGFMKDRSYDANGFLTSYTDWKGNQTTLINNTRGLITQKIEAVGTPQERTITTVWHNTLSLPITINEPNKKTDFTYSTNGQLLTRTLTDLSTSESRTTTYNYYPPGSNGAGLIASIDGSRDDVNDITHYEYDGQGNLNKVTNPLGHITQITSHDASGRPLMITDANNVVTTLVWDARGRLLSITKAGSTTSFTYDAVGQLIKATQADGSYLQYLYDDAHRLIGISDNADNKIKYVLDKMGNRISTSMTDTGGNIFYSESAIFDKLSHLKQSLGADSQVNTINYDANNNPLDSTDALSRTQQQGYDALDRLIKRVDPDNQETHYQYDSQDNLTKVTDAKGLETTYVYNGYDEVITQTSPDTGTTTYTYDKVGNRISMTDARGVTVSYNFDALNRLTSTDYTDNTLDINHSYDSGINGIGRLSSTVDASGTTTYSYDERGNLLSQTRVSGADSYTTSYTYNLANRLVSMTYPSGNSLQYQRAANGEISQITATIDGVVQVILSDANYQPFGPLKSFTYGNTLAYVASFDASSRLTGQNTAGIQDNTYSYNTVDNVLVFNDLLETSRNQQFNYDNNDRLTLADGNYGAFQYVFDVVGNRTQKSNGSNTDNYSYGSNSHHLQTITGSNPASYQYDAVGNTTDNGTYQFVYGENSRLHQVMDNGAEVATYTYNAQGQRTHKQVGNGTTQPPSAEPQTSTVYDDAEDGNTVGWGVYDNTPAGAVIVNVFDADKNSQVIEFTGGATQNGYRLGHNNANHANAWSNTAEKVISWESKYTESFVVYIGVQTEQGFRYLYYTPINNDRGIHATSSHYIHHGIGSNLRNGAWYTVNRDLEADLKEFEPTNSIISVNGFLIRGSGRVDNIALLKNLPPPAPVPAQIVYEDAENGNTTGWGVYDQTPAGATISNVFDTTKNSNVIELVGSATQNGYRLGHNNANHANAWGNTDHKTISWDSVYSESFVVYIGVQTTQGFRYLYYTPINSDRGIHTTASHYIHHGLGTNLRDGTWHTTTRNLEADLQEFEPTNEIISVNGFLIRGSGRIDNIVMSGADNAGSDTYYIYDLQGNLISEISNNSHKDYIHFNGQPLAMIEGGQVYYYHNNHLGTPEVMTDQNQAVVWKATHTPYGEASITTEMVANNIRLPGQYFDAETDLHYNYFRYYDASIGRYVTSDPIGLDGGINTYGYVGGNPVNFVDDDGLAPRRGGSPVPGARFGNPLGNFNPPMGRPRQPPRDNYRDLIPPNLRGPTFPPEFMPPNIRPPRSSNQCVSPRWTRNKNKIPDIGEPNSLIENRPGTTRKKFGPNGRPQKEWNAGHPDAKNPIEREPHIHDYKPANPRNPSGMPERQPGRTPRDRDLNDLGFY